jgi:uroporphyrin-3 C-methyltransferase
MSSRRCWSPTSSCRSRATSEAALIALQTADARLSRLDRPAARGLRKAIARDIQRLELAPHVDVIGISARLDNLINADRYAAAGDGAASARAAAVEAG